MQIRAVTMAPQKSLQVLFDVTFTTKNANKGEIWKMILKLLSIKEIKNHQAHNKPQVKG